MRFLVPHKRKVKEVSLTPEDPEIKVLLGNDIDKDLEQDLIMFLR